MAQTVQKDFPLHVCVWKNDVSGLKTALEANSDQLETKDPRGRTPLLLSVTLGHTECAKLLLNAGADANVENKSFWSVSHEAIASGDPDLVQQVIKHREYQRHRHRMTAVANLFQKLSDSPDFYVEMKWEFTSWIPLVSKMCPSSKYRISKKGGNVRIDTAIANIDMSVPPSQWQQSSVSYICTSGEGGQNALIQELNHDRHTVFRESIPLQLNPNDVNIDSFNPPVDSVAMRLTSPIVTTYVDTEKIAFERSKSGLFGWGSNDKVEKINNYDCKVFCAVNVELITKTRTEHLTQQDKEDSKNHKTPLETFLSFVPFSGEKKNIDETHNQDNSTNPCNITLEEYFSPYVDLSGRDIGRPREIAVKSQKFNATLWLAENYPLSLPEQVTPIIDLLASTNAHFARLKNFIELQLPSGFPIAIEIPLYHVLTARVTFGNLFAIDSPVEGITTVRDENETGATITTCVVHESIFEIPRNYSVIDADANVGVHVREYGEGGNLNLVGDEELYLQWAIQQSLSNSDEPADFPVGNWPNGGVLESDAQLQRAITESLRDYRPTGDVPVAAGGVDDPSGIVIGAGDDDIRAVLEESAREEQQRAAVIAQKEEEELQRVLELSLLEK